MTSKKRKKTDKPIWKVVGTLECGCPKTQDDWNKMCGACTHLDDPCEGVSCGSDANECEYFSRINMFGALPDLPSYEDGESHNTCCVCGHSLLDHIDEDYGWRCHRLGKDGYQCECYLRKVRGEGDKKFYSLSRRVAEMKKELEMI